MPPMLSSAAGRVAHFSSVGSFRAFARCLSTSPGSQGEADVLLATKESGRRGTRMANGRAENVSPVTSPRSFKGSDEEVWQMLDSKGESLPLSGENSVTGFLVPFALKGGKLSNDQVAKLSALINKKIDAVEMEKELPGGITLKSIFSLCFLIGYFKAFDAYNHNMKNMHREEWKIVKEYLQSLSRLACKLNEREAAAAAAAAARGNEESGLERIDVKHLKGMICGLRGLSSDSEEVRALLNDIQPFIAKIVNNTPKVTPATLAYCMWGLQNMSSSIPEVRKTLKTLAPLYNVRLLDRPMEPPNVAYIINGLRFMSPAHKEVVDFIDLLPPLLLTCNGQISASDISIAVNGLRNFDSSKPQVRNIISSLNDLFTREHSHSNESDTSLLPRLEIEMDAKDVERCLGGLRLIGSKCHESRKLISILTPMIKNCKESLSPLQLSRAFQGIQNMSNDNPEVDALLEALVSLLARAAEARSHSTDSETLSAQHVKQIVFGLRNMSTSTDHNAPLKNLLVQLTPLVAKCDGSLNADEVALMLSGLQGISSHFVESRNFIKALLPLLYRSGKNETLTPLTVSRIMKGLRMQRTGEAEVREVLAVLTPLISSCNARFTANEVADTISGLSKMNSTRGEVLDLLRVLAPMLSTCQESLNAHQVALVMSGLGGLCSRRPEVRSLLDVITRLIGTCQEKLVGDQVAMALKGLERKHNEHAEVRNLVRFLNHLLEVRKTKDYHKRLNSQPISLGKLRGLKGSPEVASLVNALSLSANNRKDSPATKHEKLPPPPL